MISGLVQRERQVKPLSLLLFRLLGVDAAVVDELALEHGRCDGPHEGADEEYGAVVEATNVAESLPHTVTRPHLNLHLVVQGEAVLVCDFLHTIVNLQICVLNKERLVIIFFLIKRVQPVVI